MKMGMIQASSRDEVRMNSTDDHRRGVYDDDEMKMDGSLSS